MLQVQVIQDVLLCAAVPDTNSPLGFSLGAYDVNSTFIDAFALERNWGSSGRLSQESAQPWASQTITTGLYGGILFNEFGHFLLESLSRYWAIATFDKELPIIWHTLDRTTLLKWQIDIFDLLKIDTTRFIYVIEPLLLESIFVAQPGYKIQLWGHPYHFKSLNRDTGKSTIKGKKLWLSRSKLTGDRARITNEIEIEKVLIENGWTVISPQLLEISEQIGHLQEAELIAGFEGSAFHTLILTEVHAKVIVFSRTGRPINRNHLTIAQGKTFYQEVHMVDMEYLSGESWKRSSRLINPMEVIEILGNVVV